MLLRYASTRARSRFATEFVADAEYIQYVTSNCPSAASLDVLGACSLWFGQYLLRVLCSSSTCDAVRSGSWAKLDASDLGPWTLQHDTEDSD